MSKLTKSLAILTKKLKWPENNAVGYNRPQSYEKYFNPLLTPPPRSPKTVEDFRHPERLGHWFSLGMDWTNPKVDRYLFNELTFFFVTGSIVAVWFWSYCPDLQLKDWAKREAFLRTHKREALGLPLIDKNVVDPDRVHLPTEEELGDFPVTM